MTASKNGQGPDEESDEIDEFLKRVDKSLQQHISKLEAEREKLALARTLGQALLLEHANASELSISNELVASVRDKSAELYYYELRKRLDLLPDDQVPGLYELANDLADKQIHSGALERVLAYRERQKQARRDLRQHKINQFIREAPGFLYGLGMLFIHVAAYASIFYLSKAFAKANESVLRHIDQLTSGFLSLIAANLVWIAALAAVTFWQIGSNIGSKPTNKDRLWAKALLGVALILLIIVAYGF